MNAHSFERRLTDAIEALPPEVRVLPSAYGVVPEGGVWRLQGDCVCPIGALLLGLPLPFSELLEEAKGESHRNLAIELTLFAQFTIPPWQWQSVVSGFDWGTATADEPWRGVGSRLRQKFCPRKG